MREAGGGRRATRTQHPGPGFVFPTMALLLQAGTGSISIHLLFSSNSAPIHFVPKKTKRDGYVKVRLHRVINFPV